MENMKFTKIQNLPKSEQDPKLNQVFVFRCDVIMKTFPVELLIL